VCLLNGLFLVIFELKFNIMTKEEIAGYAHRTTTVNTRTEITLNNGTKVSGYFDGNITHSKMYEANEWNFVVFPPDENKSKTLFNGNDFHSIVIHKI